MTRKVNYEDDIFALSLVVRMLRDVERLQPDPELVRDVILSGITSVDAAIGRLLASLAGSPHLSRRAEHLRELARLARSFAVVLEELAAGRTPLGAFLSSRSEELGAMAARHDRAADEVDALLSGQGEGPLEERHIVSEEELRILIAPTDESP